MIKNFMSARLNREGVVGALNTATNYNDQGQDCAFAVSARLEPCPAAQQWQSSSLFIPGNAVEDESAAFVRELRMRATAITPTIRRILEQPELGVDHHRVPNE